MTSQTLIHITKDDFDRLISLAAGEQFVSREEAARIVDVTPDTIDRFADSGVLTRYYDTRENVTRPIVRYSKTELLTKTFSKVRKL